jgi:ligand-binding SRPBCC domain-containing protein
MSKVYTLKRVQLMPVEMSAAWDFFSDPRNLESITGAGLDFKIISVHHGEKMYAGQIIEYRLKPLPGINMYWMTEITHVEQHAFFVDDQRFGPYSLWHHQHHFKEVAGGIEMTDIIHYKLPFWFLGDIAHILFVKKKLKDIFDFRYQKIKELFGS